LVMKAVLDAGPPVKVFGKDYPTPDGTGIRDYIHVEDLADAHVRALDHLDRGGAGGAFNLGTGDGYTVREVIDLARKVAGRPIPEKLGKRRAGDPAVLVADGRKAKETLGWIPKHSDLETIVSSAWRWHEKHPAGYGDRPAHGDRRAVGGKGAT
jgi:UDP-glucose 4-epimerase